MAMFTYFERQNSKDCVVHSLNNAFGRKVVNKKEVIEMIDRKARELEESMAENGSDKKRISEAVAKMRDRYSTGKTFFAADIVWETAKRKGAYAVHIPVPGFSSPYLRLNALTPEIMSRPVVILGGSGSGGTHAVATRNGMLYDSELKNAVPLTKENLRKSLPRVFEAYVFVESPEVASAIRRSASISGTMFSREIQ